MMAAVTPDPQYAPIRPSSTPRSASSSGDRVVGQERAVAGEHGAAGQVFGAGDVSGNRVDRLDVAAEAFRRAGVEQVEVVDLLRGQGRQRAVVQVVVHAPPHCPVGGSTGPVARLPPLARHAAKPPSRMRTSTMPAAVSTHQARAEPARFQSS